MKKLFASILAGAMMLSFTACGDTPTVEDSITYDTKSKETTMECSTTEITETTQTTVTASTTETAQTESSSETTRDPYLVEVEEPTVTAYAEVISEKDTVKITFVSDRPLSVYLQNNAYIKDYQGEYIDKGYLNYPMESPVVCYVPIGYFYGVHGEFQVTKYASTDPMRYFKETVTIEADFSEAFSDEPITVSDPFLDAALKAEFGGSYSERDLSQISSVVIYYYRTTHGQYPSEPAITFAYHNKELGKFDNGTSSHRYSDFFEEDWTQDFPEETLNDMKYFPLLEDVAFRQSRSQTTPSEVPLPDGYLDSILVKEYTAADFS